jgi:hypothetical protein
LRGVRLARRLERLAVAQPANHRTEVLRAERRHARAKRSFAQVPARHHDLANRGSVHGAEHREHAAHRAQPAVEPELAHEQRGAQALFGELDARARDADRDRQVERGADLQQPVSARFGHARAGTRARRSGTRRG